MDPIRWLLSPVTWLWHKIFPTDESRVAEARDIVEQNIMASPQALEWLEHSGWSATGGDTALAMRNPVTRDAGIFAVIQNFSDSHNDPATMMRNFTANGLNNGTTTHAYVLNMGEGTLGNSRSNQQAVLLVDETTEPPRITLAFRGTDPKLIPTSSRDNDLYTHLMSIVDYVMGRPMRRYEEQSEIFWQGAKGDITRILGEVAARHPGSVPQLTMAGYSYGADAATRMVPRMAEAFPEWREQLSLVGFGAMSSFSPAERESIYALLGNDPTRARQLMSRNDWIRPWFSINSFVGEEAQLNSSTGHAYNESTHLEAMMDALQQQMARDPRQAEARARELVAAYRRDPDSVLNDLANYTNAVVQGSQMAAVGALGRGAPQPALH